jgi:hypothetical protein
METMEVVGIVLAFVMSVNGWFLRGIYSDMQFVKIELAKLITGHDNTKETSDRNTIEINRLRERLHKIEGMEVQILHYIEQQEKQ